MSLTLGGLRQLRANADAGERLGDWIAGAEAVALLTGAVDSGIVDALRTVNTPEQIVVATGLDKKRIEDVLGALEAHGLVRHRNGIFQIASDLELLTSADAARPLAVVLQTARVRSRVFESMAKTGEDYTALRSADILSIAEGAGVSGLSTARRAVVSVFGQALPEVETAWRGGAHHLEVGCGVGNNMFQIVTTYPRVTAVGLEIEAATANEARRRAGLLGVPERVEVRQMDASDLTDEAVFDTPQWSQFFFPSPRRASVLRALHKAMKPGGYVFMPVLPTVSTNSWRYRRDALRMALKALTSDPFMSLVFISSLLQTTPGGQRAEKRFASLNRLMFRTWGVPVKTASELQLEVEEFGFRVLRAVPVPATQFSLSRALLLARRG